MDLANEINRLMQELTASINKLAENGKKLAEKERDYKITLHTEALRLKQEKSMAVTLIDLLIYGVPAVAKLRFERDVAQTIYDTNQEHINATKLKIRILESQLDREWGNVHN